jgi:electron-transferring-flavoprotein dehydrogenase
VTRPADYPPPWSPAEAIAAPTDAEPIEVGALVVGAGPAGLAAAIRLAQLASDDPATAARLGEVPVAVLEKGKTPGSHLLSGAVIDPSSLAQLLGPDWRDRIPTYGDVKAESVLFLTRRRALRVPTPPTMRNHGNVVVSLSELGRALAREAEDLGVAVLPETVGQQLLVSEDRVVGVRTGDRGRGPSGEKLARFEPGSDLLAQVTILAEGTTGYLTEAALAQFGLAGDNPQVWSLGVKEVWKVTRPLDRVLHTMGWPLRPGRSAGEFGGSFIYPLGDELVAIGIVVGLDYSDPTLSPHDLLQALKTHPRIRSILAGGERISWGAKSIPEGGFVAFPRRFHAPGLLLCGDGVGLVNVPALKGVHYAIESGRLAAETAWGSFSGSSLDAYDAALRASFIWRDLREVRNVRQAFSRGFWLGAAGAAAVTATRGRVPSGDRPTESDAGHPLLASTTRVRYPSADGTLTFDKLSSVFLSGNRTRDDQPNHIRLASRVPRDLAEAWVNMCPAQVYAVEDEHGDGTVDVRVSPSNCIQCGAISAKGGRLTPPEGGSGPEYTIT